MAVAPEASRAAALPAASRTAEELFHEHSGWLYGYCLRVLRSPEEAEDAVQTTYLNAYRSLQQGTRPRAGSAWLLHIARNVCFARARSLGRRGRVERVQDAVVLAETAAAPDRFPEELIGLTEALERLPARQRQAILLREWQGLSYAEVAERLELTPSAVETLIFRARRSLAAELEDPGKPRRRRALYSLDLGGLLAAMKGFLAGGAGVKTAAAVAVAATATATTVVATDPEGILRERPEPSAARPTASLQNDAAAARTDAASLVGAPAAASRDGETAFRFMPASNPAEKAATPRTSREAKRGRDVGQATAAAAMAKSRGEAKGQGKAKNPGKGKARKQGEAKSQRQAKGPGGNGRALGHDKTTADPAPPTGGSAKASGGAKPARSEEGPAVPPPQASAKGLANKSAKS